MDFNKILNAMEAKAREILVESPEYTPKDQRGVFLVQVRSEVYQEQWEGAQRVFGTAILPPPMVDGCPLHSGMSYDTVVNNKAAYVRRTGKNSGAAFYDVIGDEKTWKGAVISQDGNCICGFSAYHGDEDVAIALAGLAAYEAQA